MLLGAGHVENDSDNYVQVTVDAGVITSHFCSLGYALWVDIKQKNSYHLTDNDFEKPAWWPFVRVAFCPGFSFTLTHNFTHQNLTGDTYN